MLSGIVTNSGLWNCTASRWVLKVARKTPKPVNSGLFGPELVNSSHLVVVKWEVCGGKKQMLWLLQCYYIHKIYFIGGEFTQGVMRFLLYTLFITA